MHKKMKVLMAMAAATVAATLGTASSLAVTATTWTVKPGGSFSGSAGLLEMIDTKTQGGFGCSPSSLAGTLKSGSGFDRKSGFPGQNRADLSHVGGAPRVVNER